MTSQEVCTFATGKFVNQLFKTFLRQQTKVRLYLQLDESKKENQLYFSVSISALNLDR